LVLDPFAGGSVRGIVAAKCGRRYIGIDLSRRQVEANRAQAEAICDGGEMPMWGCGDAADLGSKLVTDAADFVFSCPPYGDLEVYSDNPADLSTMPHEAFMAAYRKIIAAAIGKLKEDHVALPASCMAVSAGRLANISRHRIYKTYSVYNGRFGCTIVPVLVGFL
jgi:23S rRNA G2445 N2-methylase RlmL